MFNLNNLLQHFTTEVCGIVLLTLISLTIISIIFNLLYKLYLNFKEKKEINSKEYLKLDRRNLEKDVKNFVFKLSKKKMKKFKILCLKNGLTTISVLDDFITNYTLKRGNNKDVSSK